VFVFQRSETPNEEEESPLRQLFGNLNHQSFQEQAEEEENGPVPIMMAVNKINRMRNMNQMKRQVPVFAMAHQDEEEQPMMVIKREPEQVRPQIIFERENPVQEAPSNSADN
jgi:hypothetical protein